MIENEIFAIKHCDEVFYVDRYKILYIISIKCGCNAFKLSDEDAIKLIKRCNLVDKELFVKINKL